MILYGSARHDSGTIQDCRASPGTTRRGPLSDRVLPVGVEMNPIGDSDPGCDSVVEVGEEIDLSSRGANL